MSQAENPRKKISKILENLSIELDRVGLAEKFEYKTTSDPWIDLENAHSYEDLTLLGFTSPAQLKGQDPVQLYDRLCELTHCRQDPCVLDTLMSITRFMDGGRARPWWDYTEERKRLIAARAG